jgi:hypothetical protein
VLVVSTLGAAPAGRPRRRPRGAGPQPAPEALPLTRVTVVVADDLGDGGSAESWLRSLRRDRDALEGFVRRSLAILNLALHAQRAASMNPYVGEVGVEAALAIRAGYGGGEEVADGVWSEAIDVPTGERRRRRRSEALQPTERVAAVLGGRERIDACETLLLRARLDLDEERPREAALQLRAGMEALLEELEGTSDSDQARDLDTLAERREAIAEVANQAARGELDDARTELVAETLAICERVLRRRRILAG